MIETTNKIEFYCGDTVVISLSLAYENGDPVMIAPGGEVKFAVYARGKTPIYSKTLSATSQGSDGVIKIIIPPKISKTIPVGEHFYEVRIVQNQQIIATPISGEAFHVKETLMEPEGG